MRSSLFHDMLETSLLIHLAKLHRSRAKTEWINNYQL